jgi:hypothetical protein
MLNRVNRVLVTNVEADNTGTTIPTIINGDILILNRANAVLTGTPTITSAVDNNIIKIAQGIATGKAIVSHDIDLRNISSVRRMVYTAPAEQVTYTGYNGTSGALGSVSGAFPLNSTEYFLTFVMKDDQRVAASMRQSRRKFNYVSAPSGDTAQTIAATLVRHANRDKFIAPYISSVLVTDGTFTALTNSAAVVNASKIVTSTAHGLSAGDFVRIGGTGTTIPVYKVASITSSSVFVLDTPYQGATATVASANIGKMTVIVSVGIQSTGLVVAYNGIDLYQKVSFDMGVYSEGYVAETVTYSTVLNYGQGFWQQVRDMEYFAQGYLGFSNRVQFPVSTIPATRAVLNNTYNVVVIEHVDVHTGDLQGAMRSPVTTVIPFYSSTAPTASTKETTFMSILSSLAESAGVFVL